MSHRLPPDDHLPNEVTELPVPIEWQKRLAMSPGTLLHELAQLTHGEATSFLHSCWTGIQSRSVTTVRDILLGYDVEGFALDAAHANVTLLLRENGQSSVRECPWIFVDPPLPESPRLPWFLSDPSWSEFIQFFPRLASDTPEYSARFYLPDELCRFSDLDFYSDPAFLDRDRRTRLHWKDSWIVYANLSGDRLLVREDQEICLYNYAEIRFHPVSRDFDGLIRRIAVALESDTQLSPYNDFLPDR